VPAAGEVLARQLPAGCCCCCGRRRRGRRAGATSRQAGGGQRLAGDGFLAADEGLEATQNGGLPGWRQQELCKRSGSAAGMSASAGQAVLHLPVPQPRTWASGPRCACHAGPCTTFYWDTGPCSLAAVLSAQVCPPTPRCTHKPAPTKTPPPLSTPRTSPAWCISSWYSTRAGVHCCSQALTSSAGYSESRPETATSVRAGMCCGSSVIDDQ